MRDLSQNKGWRASNYQEIEARLKAGVDFEHAWSDFCLRSTPKASAELCTAALLVEVDPVALVQKYRGRSAKGQLEQYVNDRHYAANSTRT